MSTPYVHIPDVLEHTAIPPNGILSRTLHADDRVKIIQFVFAPGQELSAHTAPMPAILHFLEGEAGLLLGNDALEAKAGTLVHMAPQLPHGITARTKVVMLLTMLKNPPAA